MTLMDIVGPSLLAAAVIAAIIGLNYLLFDSRQQFGEDVNVQEQMVEFTKVIEWDFAKIGHRDTTGVPILIAKPDTFMFAGDMDNNGTFDTVMYFKGSPTKLSWTPNPDDFILYKVLVNTSDTMKMNLGLTKFDLTYLDSTGAATANPTLVRGLKVATVVESPYWSGDGVQSGAYWENTIFPRNLNVSK